MLMITNSHDSMETSFPGLGFRANVMSCDGAGLDSEYIKHIRCFQIHRFTYGSPVTGTVVTHDWAPVTWGPCIIDMVVATPLLAPNFEATQKLLVADLVILNHSQVTKVNTRARTPLSKFPHNAK
ncbi:hypothetical protein TNCV_1737451 [Trichonephila clavipes]|nr:hypothetical protein TNCV_1737451 [Trichonephila clavipes]